MENGFDRKKMKQIKELVLFVAVVLLVLLYRQEALQAAGVCVTILKPFLYGGVMAFVLNIPMNFIEKKLLRNWRRKGREKRKRNVSIVLSILFVALVLMLVIGTIVPHLAKTIVELGNKIPPFIERVAALLAELTAQYPQLAEPVERLEGLNTNWDALVDYVVQFLKSGATDMLVSTVTVAGSIISGAVNFSIGFIFAIYILAGKETLANQGRRILSAYLKPRHEKAVLNVLSLLNRNFSNFVSVQCLEAIILGTMFVISMTILGLPYALMIGVLIAFTALIPIVGAFIGCVVGAFLILVDSPIKAVVFVVLFFVLQQIEGNLIYPRVVGNKVGLPAIWVLMAVSVGGSLFGVPGMLFFIPLVSTFYVLLRDSVNERNAKKQETGKAQKPQGNNNRNRNHGDKNRATAGKEGGKKENGKTETEAE
ncbi:MAG: AI-2E family transporter [Roseburia sp.]|nr:AI-2E family transporter [Roseburia sp.]